MAPQQPVRTGYTIQNRIANNDSSGVSDRGCLGDNKLSAAKEYLDSAVGINNASGNPVGDVYSFVSATPSATFNDRLLTITPKEFFSALKKRIAGEIIGSADDLYITLLIRV